MVERRVSVRDLRNHGREILDRVQSGDAVIITRAGRPVARLAATTRPPIDATTLVERWSHLPAVDAPALRRDLDATIDAEL